MVAAFQNCSADVMNGASPVECDVIVCSDDQAAIQTVCDLAAKIPGVRALDGGSSRTPALSSNLQPCLSVSTFGIGAWRHSYYRLAGVIVSLVAVKLVSALNAEKSVPSIAAYHLRIHRWRCRLGSKGSPMSTGAQNGTVIEMRKCRLPFSQRSRAPE